MATSRGRTWAIVLGVNVLAIGCLLGAVEALVAVMMRHPPSSGALRRLAVGYYTTSERNIIQLMPECARYDSELTYTLRPGVCRFANREFDTEVRVNSLGLRDNEEDLSDPRIIVLGDSHAMGWGVESEEAFPNLIGHLCGVSALDAGISSYGTAREVNLLKRLDTSHVEWLIVQYSPNDLRENFVADLNGGRLVPTGAEEFERLQREQTESRPYYPGQYFVRLVRHVRTDVARNRMPVDRRPGPSGQPAEEVDLFLRALDRAPALPPDTRVIVFSLPDPARWNTAFTDRLRDVLGTTHLSAPWNGMIVLDASVAVGPPDFFTLDGHMTPAGHVKLAGLVARTMGCTP